MPGIEGRPSIVRAHAEQRTPGVDAWCDVELGFPGGATGLTANSMVGEHHSFTIRIVGTAGDLLVHDFISPSTDDRLTITTAAGTTVEHLGTRASYTYQLEAFAAHVEHGAALPFGTADAVANMAFVDTAYRAAGMEPRWTPASGRRRRVRGRSRTFVPPQPQQHHPPVRAERHGQRVTPRRRARRASRSMSTCRLCRAAVERRD